MKRKIIFISVLVVMVSIFFTTPVLAQTKNIASCDAAISSTVIIDEKIPNVVGTAILIIKIVVPILLVVFGMIDLVKGVVAQKEDEIKKGQQIFIKRLISGVIVFFVFTIVQLLISLVAGEENKNILACADCFINRDCTYRKDSSGDCPTGTKPSVNGVVCVLED